MWRFVDREIYERDPSGIRVMPLPRRTQIALVFGLALLLLTVLVLSAATAGLYWLWQREATRLAELAAERMPISEQIAQQVLERTQALEASRAALERRLAEVEEAAARERELLRSQLAAAELHAERLERELEALRAERAELASRLERVSARAVAVAQQEAEPAAPAEVPTDAGLRRLQDQIEQLRRHLNARALEAARSRRERDALSEQFRAALQAAERAAERQRERFEAELERMRAQNREAAAEIASLRQTVVELKTAKPAAVESRTDEQLAALQAERDRALERAEAAEAAAITLTADLEAARRRIAELEAGAIAPAAGPSASRSHDTDAATGDDARGEQSEPVAVSAGLFGSFVPRPPRPAPR
jgi:chromosome segregation ATPase